MPVGAQMGLETIIGVAHVYSTWPHMYGRNGTQRYMFYERMNEANVARGHIWACVMHQVCLSFKINILDGTSRAKTKYLESKFSV